MPLDGGLECFSLQLLGTEALKGHPGASPLVGVPPMVALAMFTSSLPGFQSSLPTWSIFSAARSKDRDKLPGAEVLRAQRSQERGASVCPAALALDRCRSGWSELNCQAQPRGAQMCSCMKLSIQVGRGAHSSANSLRSTPRPPTPTPVPGSPSPDSAPVPPSLLHYATGVRLVQHIS